MGNQEKHTNFGFQKVGWSEKEHKVRDVFHSVASHYDFMNNVMSGGLHHFWKFYTIELSHVRPGHAVLDLAGGSGDLTKRFCKKVGPTGSVFLTDINQQMLSVGRNRLVDEGIYDNVNFVQADAESLPFPNDHFNCISIAFGLRNVRDQIQALSEMYRTCKPGGKLMILEFSKPVSKSLQWIYDWYSFNILPKLGGMLVGDEHSYQYLVESIRMHPAQETLKTMVESVGFEDCTFRNLSGGIVALHIAYKY